MLYVGRRFPSAPTSAGRDFHDGNLQIQLRRKLAGTQRLDGEECLNCPGTSQRVADRRLG